MFFDRKEESNLTLERSKKPILILKELFETISERNPSLVFSTAIISIMDDYLLTPAEYVKKHIAINPEELAQYCLDLLRENTQNGVSCALNELPVEERAILLARWDDSHPLLKAYYSSKVNLDPKSKSEWDNVDEDLVKQHILENNVYVFPKHLLHALKIKLTFEELKPENLKSNRRGLGLIESIRKIKKEVGALIAQSSLHLNFRGEKISELELSNLNLSTLDFVESTLSNCDLKNSNFEYADFTKSKLTTLDMFDTSLNSVKFINSEIFNCTILQSQITETIFKDVQFKILNPKGMTLGVNFANSIIDESIKKEILIWVKTIMKNPPLIHKTPWLTLFKGLKETTSTDAVTMLWLMGSETQEELQAGILDLQNEQLDALSPGFKQALQNYCKDIVSNDKSKSVSFH